MEKVKAWFFGLAAGLVAIALMLVGRHKSAQKVIVEAEKRDAERETKSQEIARDVERYAAEAEAAERAGVKLPTTQEERDAELRRLGELK